MRAGLGQVVRDLRKELGVSQEGFARRLDVSLNTIKRYEGGQFEPDPIILLRMINIAPEHWKIRLVPHLPAEIVQWVGESAPRRREKKASGRYSDEAREQLHAALDVVIERAPSTAVQKVSEMLTKFAGAYGDKK